MRLRSDRDYILTEESKILIQNNNGKLTAIEEIRKQNPRFLYAVGDYTCQLLDREKIEPQIMVFDLTTKRGETAYPDRPGSITVENPQSVISGKLIELIRESIREGRKVKVKVIGEEDLAVLPIIFYAPVNSLVVYGIPNLGTGSIRINVEVKELANSIFEKMEVK